MVKIKKKFIIVKVYGQKYTVVKIFASFLQILITMQIYGYNQLLLKDMMMALHLNLSQTLYLTNLHLPTYKQNLLTCKSIKMTR